MTNRWKLKNKKKNRPKYLMPYAQGLICRIKNNDPGPVSSDMKMLGNYGHPKKTRKVLDFHRIIYLGMINVSSL